MMGLPRWIMGRLNRLDRWVILGVGCGILFLVLVSFGFQYALTRNLVQMVCEQLDRRDRLVELWLADPADRKVNMSLFDTEKAIVSGLSLLGFTPADRTRLGLVSAKTKSKLQELLDAKKDAGK